MNIILLSGGSGMRLWPLSTSARSKQFLRLLHDENGRPESMVQRVYRQLSNAKLETNHILMATAAVQQDAILGQLGNRVEIVAEPQRRNTFPAIVLSVAYLHFEKKCSPEEVVVVMPVDTYTEPSYFDVLRQMAEAVDSNLADLVLMGIKPREPSEKYGYMLPKSGQAAGVSKIDRFVEKPTEDVAREMIANGAMWNGGVFAFRLGYLMKIAEAAIHPASFEDIRSRYDELTNESFDYAVVEKAKSIAMIPFDGLWKDLGTWNSLTEELSTNQIGKTILGEDVQNTHVINELDIPIVTIGTNNLIVAACSDGILIADKEKSASLKEYVPLSQRPMYEERRWGEYRVIDSTELSDTASLTKHLFIKAGAAISYQRHAMRDEIWVLIDGEGNLVLNGQRKRVSRGDVVQIEKGCLHAFLAATDVQIIEVQIGTELTETDIERFDWNW
ncbi:sugar phosphate nucleotidyltransferase [Faecalispora anaeroviscerum]|uniref:sugar phosphate nucleotidyltransferase n=1 Tax=Faecalispora anaeroviscerum TaxID=2991836 RepID=UPI0024BACA30|nr:sugar phosphate nucleotidyltransferase [Faecalispora anaeroviscerum]